MDEKDEICNFCMLMQELKGQKKRFGRKKSPGERPGL